MTLFGLCVIMRYVQYGAKVNAKIFSFSLMSVLVETYDFPDLYVLLNVKPVPQTHTRPPLCVQTTLS